MLRLFTPLVFSLLFSLAACGGGGGTRSTPGPTSGDTLSTTPTASATTWAAGACWLLTVAEIEGIARIEDPVVQTGLPAQGPEYDCVWSDHEDPIVEQVAVMLTPRSSWVGINAVGAEDIEGLGQRAIVYGDHPTSFLTFWDGGWEVMIVVQKAESSPLNSDREAAEELAGLIVSRIDQLVPSPDCASPTPTPTGTYAASLTDCPTPN